MKSKALIISLVLVLLATTGVVFMQYRPKPKPSEPYFGNKINSFCVNQTCLQKDGNEWILKEGGPDKPAENDSVDIFISNIKNVRLTDLISTNKDKFKDMGFDESKKLVLAVEGKKLEIGKVNSNYTGTFVKEEGGDKVYLTDSVIDKTKIENQGYWDRKLITNWPTMQITKVEVRFQDKNKVINKEGDKWSNDTWINTLSHLKAVSYLPGFATKGNEIYEYTIDSTVANGTKYTLAAGSEWQNSQPIYWATTDNKYYFGISKDDYVLLTGIKF